MEARERKLLKKAIVLSTTIEGVLFLSLMLLTHFVGWSLHNSPVVLVLLLTQAIGALLMWLPLQLLENLISGSGLEVIRSTGVFLVQLVFLSFIIYRVLKSKPP